MSRIRIQKHCEVLSLDPDPKEKDTYNVKVLLTNNMKEFSPEIPLKLKGSPNEIAKILTFLGEEFSKSDHVETTLDDLSIAPIRLEMHQEKVIAKDSHGQERFKGSVAEELDVNKIQEFSRRFFSK